MNTLSSPAFELRDFTPPPAERVGASAWIVACVAHGLLFAALTWGTQWLNEPPHLTVSAELWADIPQQAAPALQAPPLPEPPATVSSPPVEATKPPDIVQEKTKPRKAPPKKAEKTKPPEPSAKDKRQREQAKRKEREEHEKDLQRELIRQEQIKRMTGLAGAAGQSSASGQALQSTGGLSKSYQDLINARIYPNVVFPALDRTAGNPETEITIRLAPDGTIIDPKITKRSGNAEWDAAALSAVQKTESLPRDATGFRPPSMTLVLRPKR